MRSIKFLYKISKNCLHIFIYILVDKNTINSKWLQVSSFKVNQLKRMNQKKIFSWSANNNKTETACLVKLDFKPKANHYF